MTLIFAETHNMIAYLTKFDASEGFNQIINFLNGSSIKYALTVNPNIYVLCIKQFWTSVAVNKVNDVTRLQALVDKKKVVITEASIRDSLCLDDAEGVECLPNKEIFTELARMGYEKPSAKLTFLNEFFSSQWKFFIHEVGEDADEVHAEDVNTAGVVAEGGIIANINADEDVVLEDAKDVFVEKSADVDESVGIQGRTAESQAQIYQIDLEHANKVLSMQDKEESEPAKIQEVVDVVTISKIITEFVIAASEIITAASTTITAVDVPIPTAIIAAALTLTVAPSRKRKGVFDSNVAFLQKIKEQMDEEDSRALKRMNESQEEKVAKKHKLDEEVEELKRHLQIVPNDDDEVYTEATPLALKVPVIDYENNKPYYKIKRADGVSTPKCDEDRLELIELMVFLLSSDEKVGMEVSAVDLQVSTVGLILLMLLQKFLLFGLTNWCCSLNAIRSQNKKKVVITEASIRDSLCLDDAEGVECLPNKEIFTELARMGYEKPSAKLTFLKEFFSSQWKFLIHTILFVRNADSPTKFYMYPRFLQLMIRKQVGDLSSHSTKYTSPALTQKEAGKDVDEVHAEDVNTAGVIAEGAASDDVNAAVDEPSIPSLKQPTPPPQLSQDIPLTSQDARISMDLLQNLMDTCITLTRRVNHLEQDKIAQALEITKLKSRVKKFKIRNKASKIKRLKKVGTAQRIDTSYDTIMDDGRIAESQAQIYQIDIEHANKVLSMQDEEESEPAKIQEVVDVVTIAKIITEVVTAASDTITAASTTITAVDVPIPTAIIAAALTLTAAPSRKRKGVVIKDPQETTTPSTLKHSESKSKDKGKGILRKQKVDKDLKRYQALKRKPQTEAQARKNMMIYLKNVTGFKMDYFKGMSYDDIQKVAKKQKLDEEVEELKRHLQIVPNDDNDDVYIEATPLALKVPVVDYKIYNENNKPYYKIKRADGLHQLYLSFLSLIKNFDREDLEALWRLPDIMLKSGKIKEVFMVKQKSRVGSCWNHVMLNNVQLEVEEESEVSWELLRFIRQQRQE
nr:hypothetical protein [Tanacetum cinerariifolium]